MSALTGRLGIILVVALLAVAGIGFWLWKEQHDARIRAESVIEAQRQAMGEIDRRMGARQDALESSLKAIAEQKAQVRTPDQVIKVLPQYVTLPSAPAISPPLPNGPSTEIQNHSISGGGLFFPPEDVKPLFDHLADCQACKVELGIRQADVVDLEAKVRAVEKQRDAALKIRGGFWSRALGCGLRIAVPAGVGGAFGGRTGAIAGAGAGGATCFIKF